MPKYRIEAIAKDKIEAADKILNYLADPHSRYLTEVEETDWRDYSNVLAKEIYQEFEDQIGELISEDPKQEACEIMDSLDIKDRCLESADGTFIYDNIDNLIDAMLLMKDYPEHVPDDTCLWEGKTEYRDIINIVATHALESLVTEKVEELIGNRIAEYQDEQEDSGE